MYLLLCILLVITRSLAVLLFMYDVSHSYTTKLWRVDKVIKYTWSFRSSEKVFAEVTKKL